MRAEGFVLTGGQSRRMGRDKALLSHRGMPLALWVARELEPVATRVRLVGRADRHGGLGLPVVEDIRPGLGPLAGLEAALTAAETPWILLVACDMPAVSTALFRNLLAAAASCRADAVVPCHAGRGREPLCAAYHRRALRTVRRALDSGDLKMLHLLESLKVYEWTAEDRGAFRNVNTAEDLAASPLEP